MVNHKSIESTYDYRDAISNESSVSNPGISGKVYNGNFSLTLEEAQKAKPKYILKESSSGGMTKN